MATTSEMEAALQRELVWLWTDFSTSMNRARVRELDPGNERTGWSIDMLNLADRIADVTRLIGSPSWTNVSVHLLLDGWWSAVHERSGLPVPDFDRSRVQNVRDQQTKVAP